MNILVDNLIEWPHTPDWPFGKACHLFTTPEIGLESLHRFAWSIGLRSHWFQDKGFPHYDLTESRRAMAVRMGAIEVDRRCLVEVKRRWLAAREPEDLRVREFPG